MALIDARGFKKEDYAKLHPAGAIGRALLLKARNIMRTGDNIARVTGDTLIKNVVTAMTKAHAGIAFVVDPDGKLIGIYTDGDFRRGISDEGDLSLLNRPISTVMVRKPISVGPDDLAVDILRVFEQRKIDDLPVIDENGTLLGGIDIQDLPKMKVM